MENLEQYVKDLVENNLTPEQRSVTIDDVPENVLQPVPALPHRKRDRAKLQMKTFLNKHSNLGVGRVSDYSFNFNGQKLASRYFKEDVGPKVITLEVIRNEDAVITTMDTNGEIKKYAIIGGNIDLELMDITDEVANEVYTLQGSTIEGVRVDKTLKVVEASEVVITERVEVENDPEGFTFVKTVKI